jgi:hypothetical protein
MITTIRNQFKQSTYRYIALFVVFVFAFGMISLPSLIKHEKASIAWAAKVNGQKISYQDFAQEVAERSEWLAHVRSQYGQYADLLLQAMHIPTDPKALAIEMLVKEDLINQYAQSLGIELSADYIAQSINDQKHAQQSLSNIVPSFLFDQSGSLDTDKLKAFLRHKGLSISSFENKVEKALIRLQAMQFVGSSCYVPLFDIKQEIIATRLGKQFSYITFSFEQFLAEEKKSLISDEDLLAFYTRENTQKRRYWVPEKRAGIMWKFDAKNYGLSISEEEIAQYYEDNKVSKYVVDPIKIQVRQITEKQLAGLSLEQVRQDLVNNATSEWAQKWELLDPFARGEKKGAFEREAFVLQNVGDISPVIDTKDGKVILQLVKRIPRTYKPLLSVKTEIKNALIEKHFKKNFVKDIKAIASGDNSKAIELFISQKTGKKENVTNITKTDSRLSQELFGLKKGEYAFFVENETGFAVKLTEIEERNLPALDSIKDVVKGDLWEERAHNRMVNKVQEAKGAAAQLSFKEVQKQFGGSLNSTDMIQPTDNKKIQELDKKQLPARTMLALDKVGSLVVHNGERESVLIKLDAIEQYSENMLIDAQNEAKGALDSLRTKLQLESFVASLHRNATIETNESILIAGEEYSE